MPEPRFEFNADVRGFLERPLCRPVAALALKVVAHQVDELAEMAVVGWLHEKGDDFRAENGGFQFDDRRVGGLEIQVRSSYASAVVFRRVGGLEVSSQHAAQGNWMFRRGHETDEAAEQAGNRSVQLPEARQKIFRWRVIQ